MSAMEKSLNTLLGMYKEYNLTFNLNYLGAFE